jgi:hypothetical protein
MTVEREHAEKFRASFSSVLDAIREVLAEGHPSHSYEDTVEAESGRRITTTVKPWQWPLFLTTAMSIDLDPDDTSTRVTVRLRSQWFLIGDIFNFYGGYIRDLLQAVHTKLTIEAEQGAGVTR